MESKKSLTYKVTREGATEPPFSGEFNYNKKEGIYSCINCGKIIFSSEHKFDSGTGWPAFYALIEDEAVKEQMFKAKLAAFELPHVKSSTDKDLKTKLRKAETIKEVFKVLSHF